MEEKPAEGAEGHVVVVVAFLWVVQEGLADDRRTSL